MNLKQKLQFTFVCLAISLLGVSVLCYQLAGKLGLGCNGQSVMTLVPLIAAVLVFSVQFLSLDLQMNLLLMLVT